MMCVWSGCAMICVYMICIMSRINLVSSSCDGMYIWSNNHGFSELFFIWISCRHDDILAWEGICVMFFLECIFLVYECE